MREIEEELKSYIKACVYEIISLCYCYYVPPKIKAGVFRLISLLPVCAFFLVLPLFFSSAHFTLITSTFLAWHTNFKLILFAFDKGPLFPCPSSLTQFLSFTCFPIIHKQNSRVQDHNFPKFLLAVKVVIFGVALHFYNYTQYFPSIIQLGHYALHVYLALEIPITILKDLLAFTLGCDLEPIFKEPYLATSLQEFWGRRWNLPASALLRLTVYIPVRRACQHVMNIERAAIVGVLASFLVSGLIHELVFFYVTRASPTWEVTWYFVLQGVCTVVEVIVKRKTFVGKWVVVPRMVSRVLTVGFVIVTGGWLFFPQFKRSGVMERFAYESLLFTHYVKREFAYFLWK